MSHINVALRCSVAAFADDRVLLVHRPDRADWTLPGGTPRGEETLLACARRELREETGMMMEAGSCGLIVESLCDGQRLVDLGFLAAGLPSGHPRLVESALKPQFVPLRELDAITLHPPIASHLRQLHRCPREAVQYVHQVLDDTSVRTG